MENINEIQHKEPFYSYRKITRCLSAGISFLTDNFLHIVKLSLPYVVALAVFQTALAYIGSNSSLLQVMMGNPEASSVSMVTLGIIVGLLLIAMFVAYSLYSGLVYRLIHIYSHDLPLKSLGYIQTLKSSVKYGIKCGVFYLCLALIVIVFETIAFVPFFIPTEGRMYLAIKLGVLLAVLLALFFVIVPCAFSMQAIFLEEGKAYKNAVYGFKKGLKYWGKSFCLALLIGLLEMLLIFVLSLPSLSMAQCYQAATLSQLNGDAVVIPTGFNFWYLVVLFVTSCLISFIAWIGPTSFAYLYASMKTDEKEQANNLYAI